ncbi:MAG: zf-HC2 domain-containing protein [Planctomycetes bacterium]|nr:zf-HC2 domain-containing protein [Planctomycetota bacterium]
MGSRPTCQEFRSQAYPYLDGVLGASERARMDGHLSGCSSCRDWIASARALDRRVLSAARSAPVPPGLVESALARLDSRPIRIGRFGPASLRAAAAVLVLVGLAAGAAYWRWGRGDGSAVAHDPDDHEIAADVFGAKVVAFSRARKEEPPERVTGEQKELQDFLSRELGFPACVPDLREAGATLCGGSVACSHLCCTACSCPRGSAYVRYEKEGIFITHIDTKDPGIHLETWRRVTRNDRDFYLYEQQPYCVVLLRTEGNGLCIFVFEVGTRDEAISTVVAALQ